MPQVHSETALQALLIDGGAECRFNPLLTKSKATKLYETTTRNKR